MRLTEKVENENNYCFAFSNYSEDLSKYNEETEIAINKTINKLGQLEDVEEKLGIDLITLFKALKNGISIKDEPLQNYPCSLNHNDIGWFLFVRTDGVLGAYYLKDYGKTWALTKEELE